MKYIYFLVEKKIALLIIFFAQLVDEISSSAREIMLSSLIIMKLTLIYLIKEEKQPTRDITVGRSFHYLLSI